MDGCDYYVVIVGGRYGSRDGPDLPPAVNKQLDALLATALALEVNATGLLVQLKKEEHDFFEYNMLSDPTKLLAAVDASLDLSAALESQVHGSVAITLRVPVAS